MALEKENLYVILIHSDRSWHVKQTAQNKEKTKGSIVAFHCSFEAGVAQKTQPKTVVAQKTQPKTQNRIEHQHKFIYDSNI